MGDEAEDREHVDTRGADPPDESGADKTPQEQRGDDPGQDPVSSPGPMGNPESDEEALSQRQQEGGESPDSGEGS